MRSHTSRARRWIAVPLLPFVLLVVACSPEAGRVRSGGPGADIGNHSATTPLHGEGVMFYNTPLEGSASRK